MSYAILESYTNTTANVRIGGLEHPARLYDGFVIYLDVTRMGWRNPTSSSDTHEAYVQFDLSKTADGRTTANGVYHAHVYAIWKGVEYEVPFSSSSRIEIDKGGGYPPTPRNHELTYVKIVDFTIMEDDHVEIKVRTDGYGTVDLVSVTKAWNLYTGDKDRGSVYIDSSTIEEDSLDDGEFYGWLRFRPNPTDMSVFPAVPIGTCHLRYDGKYSSAFLCMSQYGKWVSYEGIYQTTLQQHHNGFSANVLSLSTVKDDWTRLVNMSFYLEATTWGDIKYAEYANYIPRSGDIITASMYNGLLDAVRRCCRRVGVSSGGLPNYVSENQIIRKDFIKEIGRVVDRCLVTQRHDVNEEVLRRQ